MLVCHILETSTWHSFCDDRNKTHACTHTSKALLVCQETPLSRRFRTDLPTSGHSSLPHFCTSQSSLRLVSQTPLRLYIVRAHLLRGSRYRTCFPLGSLFNCQRPTASLRLKRPLASRPLRRSVCSTYSDWLDLAFIAPTWSASNSA